MTTPNLDYEFFLWENKFVVAGADEVGRGCLAGPVVAAVCVFSPDVHMRLASIKTKIPINDSKKLTSKQRLASSRWIKENALSWGIGFSSVYEINKLGIKKATNKAFRRAIKIANLNLGKQGKSIDHLLIDAFYISYVKGLDRWKQTPIVKGDMKSISIASASIIAKVHRDEYMQKLGMKKDYAKYAWLQNKGYGTKQHREAILRYGITKFHRVAFTRKTLAMAGKI